MEPRSSYWILIFFGSFFALTGCAEPKRRQIIDPELKPFVLEFKKLYKLHYTGDVVFGEMKPGPNGENRVGLCSFYKNAEGRIYNSFITINPDYFRKASDGGKRQLMFHELGHCLMGLNHNDSKDQEGCPVSIMYPFAFGNGDCFKENQNYYIEELREEWVNSF